MPRVGAVGWLAPGLDLATGLRRLQRLYDRRPTGMSPVGFIAWMLEVLRIEVEVSVEPDCDIPSQGPMVVVANHPYGAIEGVAIARHLLHLRPDVKILANSVLCRIPEIAPLVLPVDTFGGRPALASLRSAARHLAGGGCLLTFPSGMVSRFSRSDRQAADPPWHSTATELALRANASVLPVFVEGRSSTLSLCLGALHTRLRTVMLPRDLLAQQGKTLRLRILRQVPAGELGGLPEAARTDYLRMIVYSGTRVPAPAVAPRRSVAALAAPAAPESLTAEIGRLPADCTLLTHGDFSVYCAPATDLPTLLPELGRLRERSFRMLGEGSGRERDLDRFDAGYRHLFVFCHSQRALIGAYRLGYCDELCRDGSVGSLYTRTLFGYDRRLLDHLGSAVELGRSFVVPEAQRSFQALRLLWAGIDRVLTARPEVRWLFGPVSISPQYSDEARSLMVAALRSHRDDPALRFLVRPLSRSADAKLPPHLRNMLPVLADGRRLSQAVARLERGPGLPVLLRHYLDLEARFAGFQLDPAFGGSLAGLMFVEVAKIPPKFRERLVRRGYQPPR